MKISFLILTGFFVILLLFSITTYINYMQAEKVDENSDRFAMSSSIIRQSNRFQRNIISMVSGLRGYLLTSEPSFIQSYDSAVVENTEILQELPGLIQSNRRQKELLVEIENLHQQWVVEFALPLVEAKENATLSDSSALSFNRLYRVKLDENLEKTIQQNLQRKFREFTNYEYSGREHQKEILIASMRQTRNISFSLTTLSIVIGIVVAIFLARHISSAMMKMISMADTIASGNYSVQINDKGKDEFSRLTRSLNNMAKMLAENISLLRLKNEELDQFAHIVSHDLKGPLRGIDNVVSWIEEDHSLDLPPKVREYITLIKGRVTRVENMLNGILSYSRVGRDVQPKELVNVNELIEEVKGYLPVKQDIELQVQCMLPVFETERLPLFQIFSNLISNAYKHQKNDKAIVKIHCQEYKDHFRFMVQDNGPGIAKSYHEKIFMIFQTLQERDSFESTGVGLAIVKRILTDRKLSIEVISEPGMGSVFAFTWPRK